MSRFTTEDVDAVKRLLKHAKRKTFIRDFLLNAYNPRFSCDVRTLMCYSDGFGGDMTFKNDVYRVLALMINGVETNELVGDEIMEALARERRVEDAERGQ